MDTLIFRITTVVTPLGILNSGFRFGFLARLDFHTLLALLLCMPCLLACLPVCFTCLSLAWCYVCLHCFIFSHYMFKFLLGAIIHAFWVLNALFYTIAMPPPTCTCHAYLPFDMLSVSFFTIMSIYTCTYHAHAFCNDVCCLLAMIGCFLPLLL